MNLRCPLTLTAIEVKAIEIDMGEVAKDPEEGVVAQEQD